MTARPSARLRTTGHPARFSPDGPPVPRLAGSSAVGAASGAFLSPVSKKFSVAFLAPFRVATVACWARAPRHQHRRDKGAGLIVNDTPGVAIQLGAYEKARGRMRLNGPSSQLGTSGLGSPRRWRSTIRIGAQPQSTIEPGHRAMVAALPLTIGEAHQNIAVGAPHDPPNPDIINAWNPGNAARCSLIAFVTLIGSIVGLSSPTAGSHGSSRPTL